MCFFVSNNSMKSLKYFKKKFHAIKAIFVPFHDFEKVEHFNLDRN